jgi:hypothetical protein
MAKRALFNPSKRALARFRCRDCGVNVIKIGEYVYWAKPKVWREAKAGEDDLLCIGCLDQRLGRQALGWFEIYPMWYAHEYPWMGHWSDRLLQRLGVMDAKGEWTLPAQRRCNNKTKRGAAKC